MTVKRLVDLQTSFQTYHSEAGFRASLYVENKYKSMELVRYSKF